MEQHYNEFMAHSDYDEENKSLMEKWHSASDEIMGSDDASSGNFDCNICLDSVNDPVVTLCGHLYCWPCIYKWLSFPSDWENEHQYDKHQECPVCKSKISRTTLIPLYGPGQSATKSSKQNSSRGGSIIPSRPSGLEFHTIRQPATHRLDYSQQRRVYPVPPMLSRNATTLSSSTMDPMISMFGEMIYTRLFGTSMTNLYNTYPESTNPRIRRQIMRADKSLNRICFFLVCCTLLCLLLF